jgi:hypothetical protein
MVRSRGLRCSAMLRLRIDIPIRRRLADRGYCRTCAHSSPPRLRGDRRRSSGRLRGQMALDSWLKTWASSSLTACTLWPPRVSARGGRRGTRWGGRTSMGPSSLMGPCRRCAARSYGFLLRLTRLCPTRWSGGLKPTASMRDSSRPRCDCLTASAFSRTRTMKPA